MADPGSSVLFCICKSRRTETHRPATRKCPRKRWALLDLTLMTQRVLDPPSGSQCPTDTWKRTIILPTWKAGDHNGLKVCPGQGNPLESLAALAPTLSALDYTHSSFLKTAHTTNSSEGL